MDTGSSSSNAHTENNADKEEILPGFQTFDAFRQAAFKLLMEATKNSNNLPMGQSWDYYTSFPSFKNIMDAEGSRVLNLISMILRHQGMKGNIVRRDFEDKFDLIVDANDSILERVGCNLDEMSGIRRNPEPVLLEVATPVTRPVSGSWNVNRKQSEDGSSQNQSQPIRLLTAKNIQRPQISFKDKIDNSNTPFEPRIKDKPNSLKPLSISLEINEEGDECFSHPYEYELDRFKPPAAQLKQVTPCKYKPVEETPLVYIERKDQLPDLVQDLAKYSEIAVDLEHHSYRSFQGFTCLMQISTRDTDYIIDTLALRNKLHCLNDVFTKSTIMKVFHGADHDIEWLQRDLSVYVVNMFDTHQAAKQLNFAQLSLAFLLRHYCGVVADKRYQLADWRIRPLPEELITYAREDTHYLLYIYDMMKNALLDAANGQNNLLRSVFNLSTELCKKKYEKPALKEDSHMLLYRRNKKLYDNRQLYALRELYRWRDKIARTDDESIGYVLPNHMMLQIAETLPREMQGILACCNPIPPLVRQNLLPLHYIVLQAREQSLIKPILEDAPQVRVSVQSWNKINLDGLLHCPHDLVHIQDFRDDLPTLMAGTLNITDSFTDAMENLMREPSISLFEEEEEEETDSKYEELLNLVTFVCPYERYKRVTPFVQSQEAAQTATETSNENEDSERIDRIKQHFLEVTTKVEKQKKSKHKNNKERQEEEAGGEEQEEDDDDKNNRHNSMEVGSNVEKHKKSKHKKTKERKEEDGGEEQQEEDDEDQRPNRSHGILKTAETMEDLKPLREKKRKRNNKRKVKDPDLVVVENDEETPSIKRAKQFDDVEIMKKKKKKKKQQGPEEGFQPFNYDTYNFDRFQGGSVGHHSKYNIEGNFKAKGQKHKQSGKKNKSMTYNKKMW